MIHLIVQASKYLMIFLFLVYTFECFHVFKFEGEEEEQKHIYHVQRTLLFLFHFDAFLVLYITTYKFKGCSFRQYHAEHGMRLFDGSFLSATHWITVINAASLYAGNSSF